MSRIRVLVADDEPTVREALAELIAKDSSLDLVAAAADAREAVEMASLHHPDVALLDVKMPGGGGPVAAREIRSLSPHTRVIALTAHEDRATILEMVRAGAVGYLTKGSAARRILDAVHRSVLGQGALSGEVAAAVLRELAGKLEREDVEVDLQRRQTKRIRGVLESRAFVVVFQPIADLRTGRVVGVEALTRFEGEPRRPPDEWFAEAEAVGLRLELELATVAAALAEAPNLPPDAYVSVNLSPDTVRSPEMLEVLEGAPSDRLVVEITEHAPVADYEELREALEPLRRRGGRLAVDDAGAGFASLRHILRLGPDIIKLDISLTRGIHLDQKRRALAAALISFAGEIQATIVAEGIETEFELSALRSLGVTHGQGYFLGKPRGLPVAEVIEALAVSAVRPSARPHRRGSPGERCRERVHSVQFHERFHERWIRG